MGSIGTEKRYQGFCEWNPRDETKYWLQCVNEVLQAYRQYWPLTIRQIFYRLVANYEYSKTEQAYGRLINYLSRARRAQLVPFNAIRDDGAISRGMVGNDSVAEWIEDMRASAEEFNFNRMDFQPVRVEIFCEAAGMVPLLANAVADYGVDVHSGGGFNSLTTVRRTAHRITSDEKQRKSIIINFGDYDPSGRVDLRLVQAGRGSIRLADERGAEVRFDRVALTEDQVDEHGDPYRAAKVLGLALEELDRRHGAARGHPARPARADGCQVCRGRAGSRHPR
jgi:hypothetical protein